MSITSEMEIIHYAWPCADSANKYLVHILFVPSMFISYNYTSNMHKYTNVHYE